MKEKIVLDRRKLAGRLKNLLVQLAENMKSVMLKIVNFSNLAIQSLCTVLAAVL
ncbi:hypothetical protein ISS86_02760 [Candidatus Microgenomates bacterium]|nr:hypothetical protein [Candidatus Microgenomates bacterium]